MTFAAARTPFRSVIAGIALAVALLASPELAADTVDDTVRDVREAAKSGDSALCVAKLRALKDSADPRVLELERELAKSSHDDVACAAIALGASHTDPKLLEWLRARIADKDLFKERGGRPELYKCILEALPVYRDPATLKPLEEVEKTFLTTDAELSQRAIRAYGSVPQRSVVDQLLAWLGVLDQAHGGKSSGGTGGKTRYAPEVQKARDTSALVLVQTLSDLTDKDFGSEYADWKKWWTENAKTFEFPKPGANADVDFSKLTEWTEPRYGYTVRRPLGTGWELRGKNEYFRVQLLNVDPTGTWRGYCGWNVLRSAGSNLRTVRDYAEWWVTRFNEHEVARYFPGGEPTITLSTGSGVEWTVVTAKGVAKESMVAWGEMEHRVYITKIDPGFLYVWCVVSQGASPEVAKATWQAAEKTVLPPR